VPLLPTTILSHLDMLTSASHCLLAHGFWLGPAFPLEFLCLLFWCILVGFFSRLVLHWVAFLCCPACFTTSYPQPCGHRHVLPSRAFLHTLPSLHFGWILCTHLCHPHYPSSFWFIPLRTLQHDPHTCVFRFFLDSILPYTILPRTYFTLGSSLTSPTLPLSLTRHRAKTMTHAVSHGSSRVHSALTRVPRVAIHAFSLHFPFVCCCATWDTVLHMPIHVCHSHTHTACDFLCTLCADSWIGFSFLFLSLNLSLLVPIVLATKRVLQLPHTHTHTHTRFCLSTIFSLHTPAHHAHWSYTHTFWILHLAFVHSPLSACTRSGFTAIAFACPLTVSAGCAPLVLHLHHTTHMPTLFA